VLIFVIGTLIVANAWGAIDAKFATSAAAREATRAAVEAAPGADLQAVATSAAVTTLEGHGRTSRPGCRSPRSARTTLERCAEVGFAVQIDVPVLACRSSTAHHELPGPQRAPRARRPLPLRPAGRRGRGGLLILPPAPSGLRRVRQRPAADAGGVLVLFLLAGIAVDAAVQFLGQRRVADLAASVAQDAVASVDVESFYGAADLGPAIDRAPRPPGARR
jgi:hypothetical protein